MKSETNRAPWFCPSCRRTGEEAPPSGLCAHCGTRIEAQGYCLVCEEYLPRSVGDYCPKHDIVIEEGPPPSPHAEDLGPWVEVGRYPDSMDCQPQCIRLEAEGIPTTLDGVRMGSRSMYQVATGGVTLRVPKSLEAEARVILHQTWSRDAAELGIEDDDWDDADADGLGANQATPSRFSLFGFEVLLALFAPIAIAILVVVIKNLVR